MLLYTSPLCHILIGLAEANLPQFRYHVSIEYKHHERSAGRGTSRNFGVIQPLFPEQDAFMIQR